MTSMSNILQLTLVVLTILTLAAALIGLATRLVLLPYLRDHLVKPMAQVEKQVTENHHTNKTPTVLDRIEDVHAEVRTLSRMYDGHLAWSEHKAAALETDIERLTRARKWRWF